MAGRCSPSGTPESDVLDARVRIRVGRRYGRESPRYVQGKLPRSGLSVQARLLALLDVSMVIGTSLLHTIVDLIDECIVGDRQHASPSRSHSFVRMSSDQASAS